VILTPKKIINLIKSMSFGVDILEEGGIVSMGYSFLFKNEDSLPDGIEFRGGGRIYPLGSMKDFAIDLETHETIDLNSYISDEEGHYKDIDIIGSLKTLVPDMTFGDPRLQDTMFDVWVFVKAPKDRMFPVRMYYGPTRLALGRWDFKCDESKVAIEFEDLVNFNPGNLSIEERRELVIALELGLMKAPSSYFLGIVNHDVGYRVLALQEGGSICLMLPSSAKLDFLLSLYNYEFRDNKIVKKIKK